MDDAQAYGCLLYTSDAACASYILYMQGELVLLEQ